MIEVIRKVFEVNDRDPFDEGEVEIRVDEFRWAHTSATRQEDQCRRKQTSRE